MNHNITAAAFTIVALGLVAAFDVIPGAGISAGIAMIAIGGVLFIAQLIEPNRFWLRPKPPLGRSAAVAGPATAPARGH